MHDGNDCECHNWRSKRQNMTPDHAAISQMALSIAFYATQHMAPGLWSLGTTPETHRTCTRQHTNCRSTNLCCAPFRAKNFVLQFLSWLMAAQKDSHNIIEQSNHSLRYWKCRGSCWPTWPNHCRKSQAEKIISRPSRCQVLCCTAARPQKAPSPRPPTVTSKDYLKPAYLQVWGTSTPLKT